MRVFCILILLFLEMNNSKKNVYTILASYSGGCGFSQMAKRKMIDELIHYLNDTNDSCEFKSEIYNLKIEEQNDNLKKQFFKVEELEQSSKKKYLDVFYLPINRFYTICL